MMNTRIKTATRFFAAAALGLLLAACSGASSSPENAAKAFVEKSYAGDADAVMAMVYIDELAAFIRNADVMACLIFGVTTWAADIDTMSNPPPFSFLQESDASHFSEAASRLENEAMAFLGHAYAIKSRRFFLTSGTWVAYVKQADAAARDWNGTRQEIKGRRVGKDLLELWLDGKGQRAEALAMSEQPIDEEGRYLLGYFTLSPLAGR